MKNHTAAVLTTIVMLGAGCASTKVHLDPPAPVAVDVRQTLPIVDGRTGAPMTWDELVSLAGTADVIVVGETHDDAVGHQMQRALVEDVLDRHPSTALSLEMLDRREQSIVDDYCADIIDRERFIELTASTKWRRIATDYLTGEIKRTEFAEKIMTPGWPNWVHNYQPIIDAAKSRGSSVVAANAPWALYTKYITSEEGYEPLRALTPAQQATFSIPSPLPEGRYKERFYEFMSQAMGDPRHGATDETVMLNSYRKQVFYDATMATSIVNAMHAGTPKIIHLVGQFHSDFEGGTVQIIRQLDPTLTIFTISMQAAVWDSLREEDEGRADVVVFTGS